MDEIGLLRAKLDALTVELTEKDNELTELRKSLTEFRRKYERSTSYNEDLRTQVETLSASLHSLSGLSATKCGSDIGIQVSSEEIEEAFDDQNWLKASEKANLSVADCVRAAAEEVTRQAGFVYDEGSGYYYDSTSGYYYDAEKSLYYDANTGIYFYYNPETRAYEFHSQVDVTQLNTVSEEASKDLEMPVQQNDKEKKKSKSSDSRKLKSSNNKKLKENKSTLKESLEAPRRSSKRPSSQPYRRNSKNSRSGDDIDDRHASEEVGVISADSKSGDIILISGDDSCSDDIVELDSVEEGECSDSDDKRSDKQNFVSDSDTSSSQWSTEEPGNLYPPCVRVIVQETGLAESLGVGTLFLVTCTGATVGREKTCDICLPEIEVSKAHAKFSYSESDDCYLIKDLGSQNGTFLNGERLSETKQASEDCNVNHGDVVGFGSTKLLLHIHKGSETCDDCEPGQVQAAVALANPEKKEICILSKAEKEQERKRALKQIKRKFGLESDQYEEADPNVGKNLPYQDRASDRRKTKGSDNPYEKTEVASVDKAIASDNKGFKMMQKMGWSSGEGLGKSQPGITEPIQVDGRMTKAGLGSGQQLSVSRDAKAIRKQQFWKQTRKRFDAVSALPPSSPSPPPDEDG